MGNQENEGATVSQPDAAHGQVFENVQHTSSGAAGNEAAPAPVAAQGGGGTFPSVKDLLQGFRHCWLRATVLGVLLSGTVAVLAWLYFPPAKPKARSILQVASQAPHVLFDHAGNADGANYKSNQSALIKSRLVLNSALRESAVADSATIKKRRDPVAWLERELLIESAGPEILTVSLPVDDEDESKAIVNAVVTRYLDEIEGKERTEQKAKAEQLMQLKGKYDNLLSTRRRELRALADLVGTSNPTVAALKEKITAELLLAITKDLTKTDSEIRQLQIQVAQDEAKAKLNPEQVTVPELALKHELEHDETMAKYTKQEEALLLRIESIKNANPGRGDEISKPEQNELEQLKKSMAKREAEIRPRIEADLRLRYIAEADSRARLGKENLANLKLLYEQQNRDAERLDLQQEKIGKKTVDLEQLRDEIDETDSLVKKIAGQVQALDVESNAPPRVRLIEDAQIVKPDPLKRQIAATSVSGISSLALVVVGLSWWEWRRRRIESPEHVVESLGVRVIGTIPRVPVRSQSRGLQPIGSDDKWENVLLESVDSLRTVLLHVAQTRSLKVVMVTSAVGGEGKTSLTCQLATSLARAGRSTLLIDGDLREPCVDRLFQLPKNEGLCEVLRGSEPIENAIQPTAVNGLSVLAGGQVDEDALAGLAQGKLPHLLSQVRDRFDFILLDSGPILPIADTVLMAQTVDGVLLSAMRDVSRVGFLHRAHERLTHVGIRALGVVLAGVSETHEYGHKYSYRSRNKRVEMDQVDKSGDSKP